MNPEGAPPLATIRLRDGYGVEHRIGDHLGRPLLLVCVRYYG